MSGFLAELGKKVADRWLELLVLPGLLWIVTTAIAVRLGQRHALDLARLYGWLDQLATRPTSHSLATVLIGAVGALAASATAGLGAGALGGLLRRLWVLPGQGWPTSRIVERRRRKWDTATITLRTSIASAASRATQGQDQASVLARARKAQRVRSRLGAVPPDRPNWIGQRFHSTTTLIKTAYGLDVDLVWPRLWTLLPDGLRTDLAAAQDSYAAAARLTAWSLLYAALTIFWWPAAPVAAAVLATSWIRARTAAIVLTDLVETACDLHIGDLAEKLGIPTVTPLTPAVGLAITRVLRKIPPLPASAGTDPPAA